MPKRKNKVVIRPEGQVRQSQMLMGYGPGSMIDLLEHSVLIGGLDFWEYKGMRGNPYIAEPRLRSVVASLLKDSDVAVDVEFGFRRPPAGDDSDPTRLAGVRALEFPQWFVCQNPDCRALVRSSELDRKKGCYRHQCERGKETDSVPVRFVAACKNGHLEDFPWVSFVHKGDRCKAGAPSLRFSEGATGDFSELWVRCACGAERPLSNATVPEANPPCHGHRPWLGPEGQEECDQRLRLLVTTASNAYFAQTVSALSIPEPGQKLAEVVQSLWDVLSAATPETLPAFRQIPKVKAALAEYANEDVLAAVAANKKSGTVAAAPLRTAEFRQLVGQPFETAGELPAEDADFFARQIPVPDELKPWIARIVLVPRLREVATQVGFTRIEPSTPNLQGEYDLGVQSARLGLNTEWLPAVEFLGEGVFIQLDEKRVSTWELSDAVDKGRCVQLLKGHEAWSKQTKGAPDFPGARFYLLHSLSHLLMSAISLECGYSASSLRERIYCAPHQDSYPMAGLLISTGTPGSEGTLGGLVQEGRSLLRHLRRAFDMATLCSNDPVCAAHSPQDDPVERLLEGAACHGCLYVSESSCERFNRYLDRALVVPTIGHDPELAYFGARP